MEKTVPKFMTLPIMLIMSWGNGIEGDVEMMDTRSLHVVLVVSADGMMRDGVVFNLDVMCGTITDCIEKMFKSFRFEAWRFTTKIASFY